MFILHSSNKTENLLIHLSSVIENMPLSQPFDKEVFLIQSQGMERWLSQQLASHFGVWCNFDFLFPGKFFSTLASKIDKQLNDALFDRDLMLWRFELLLRDLNGDGFKPLQNYLQGENKELKRFQLAQQLSQIFDQYQMMRPDMLDLWQQGRTLYQSDTELWQRELWLQISQSTGNKHRGALWQEAINTLNQCAENDFSDILPERLFIFGLNTLPPLFLGFLQALSRHCDVHLFLLNPAQVYWADLVNKKQFDIDSEGHPLLSALGQQGREFQQMLLEQARFSYEPDSFDEPEITNNLQQLQADILNNQLDGCKLDKDNSLSIHACHSRRREIEILKDQILLSLEQNPDLELRDIVVMAPDIQQYTPFISATFSNIQHAIADKTLRLSNTTLDVFIRFLKLSQGRFGWQGILDLLEQEVVFTNFSLSASDLELIKHWVADTQVRWGKSAVHKKDLGFPEFNQNTWQAMLDRLLMGYAVGNDEVFVDGVLPYKEIEGSSAQVLGGLNDFIQLLFKASDDLKHATSLSNWRNRLYRYADQLISSKSSNQQLERQQLNELLDELIAITQIHNENISLDIVVAWLESQLSESKSSNGFLRGQLTFCSMLPMRSIPFKVIALLGLNEGEFPKIDRHLSFDLIAHNFRLGDRSRRTDDRYQFLEILLSSRQQLIITYIGQSNQNNAEISPSVVISELLDVLNNYYQLDNLVTKHPIQPFSPQYFNEDPELFSFSSADYETVLSLQKIQNKPQHWWQKTLDHKETEIITLNELFSFYRHPQQYFIQQQLGLRFNDISAEAEEREPFSIHGLDAYAINQQWVDHQLNNQNFPLDKLQAQGKWISGICAELEFEQQNRAINEFTQLIQQQNLGPKQPDCAIDIHIGNYRLIGSLSNLYEHGSLIYRYAKPKGKDFMLAWLHHLVINQHQTQNTCLISLDQPLIFTANEAKISLLEQLLTIYKQGLQQPNCFYTEAAFAYVTQTHKLNTSKRSKTPAIISAREQLKKQLDYDRYLQQLYQNVEDLSKLLNTDFENQCTELILPVWQAVN